MRFKKIMLIMLLLVVLTIGAVSATENNSTDDVVSIEQTVEISTIDNSSEVLSASDDDVEVVAADDNASEVLSVENNNESLAVSSDGGDVLSVAADQETLASSYGSTVQGFTNYKTFTLCKFKLPIRYLKFENGYKPSKKNKKLWRQYKSYKRYAKKTLKRIYKNFKKVAIRASNGHWHFYGDTYYRYYKSGRNIVYILYQKAYRSYHYDWLTNEEWWD